MIRSNKDKVGFAVKTQSGFSLLEVMIALSVLSMVTIIIWQSMSFGVGMKSRVEQLELEREHIAKLVLLRPILKAAVPNGTLGPDNDTRLHLANGELEFVTTGVYADHWLGYSRIKIQSVESSICVNQQSLLLFWQPASSSQLQQAEWDQGRVLLDCLDTLTISATGLDSSGQRVTTNDWQSDSLPNEIEIQTSRKNIQDRISFPILRAQGTLFGND